MHKELTHHHQLDARARSHSAGQGHRVLGIAATKFNHIIFALNDLAHGLGQQHIILLNSPGLIRGWSQGLPAMALGEPVGSIARRLGQGLGTACNDSLVAFSIEIGPQMQRLHRHDGAATTAQPLDIQIRQQQVRLPNNGGSGAVKINQAGAGRTIVSPAHGAGDGHKRRVFPGPGNPGINPARIKMVADLSHRI